MNENIYAKNGYKSRADYLLHLADEFCISPDQVAIIAELLGPEEDFDGLISELEDRCGMDC